MNCGRIVGAIGIVMLAGCGSGQKGESSGVPAAGTGTPAAALAEARTNKTYEVALEINSAVYQADKVGGLMVELQIPAGVEPEAAPSAGGGVFELRSPVALRPECLPAPALAAAAWVPGARVLRLAIVSARGMTGYGRCVELSLPAGAGFVMPADPPRTLLTEVVLSDGSRGEANRVEVEQVVELR